MPWADEETEAGPGMALSQSPGSPVPCATEVLLIETL